MSPASLTLVAVILTVICYAQVTGFPTTNMTSAEMEELLQMMDSLKANNTKLSKVIKEIAIHVKSGPAPLDTKPQDCADLFDAGHTKSGVYIIYVGRGTRRRPVSVFCDMTTNGGGWTVIQKRYSGELNFNHQWNDYANGFGSVFKEYWLGNNNTHALTLDKQYTLRIDMADFDGNARYAEYTDFKMGNACEKYKLISVGTYCGDAGESLLPHVGQKFSTSDQDNDSSTRNCAVTFKGAWWYNDCYYSNLNGLYLRGKQDLMDGMTWSSWLGFYYSLKISEMKIRPANFNV